MKKILLILSLVLIICGCSKSNEKKQNEILTDGRIKFCAYYYDLSDTLKKDSNYYLFNFVIFSDDKSLDMNKIDFEIKDIDKIGVIDKELSKNKKYTTDILDKKLTSDDNSIGVNKCYIIKTNKKLTATSKELDNLSAKITYHNKDNNMEETYETEGVIVQLA